MVRKIIGCGYLLPLLLTVFFYSCDSSDDSSGNRLQLRGGEEVKYDSQGQFLEIVTEGPWTLSVTFEDSPESGWCTASYTSGTGREVVWITYSKNEGETRAANFTVDFDGKNRSIRLIQLSKAASQGDVLPVWLELPEFETSSTRLFVRHYVPDKDEMRNYSIFYDTENHIPLWVAYPLHTVYTAGSGRTNDWQFDPEVSRTQQPDLSSGIINYDRGHMLPSASRYLTGTNAQTFYYTNMTPQINGFNGYVWAKMEALERAFQGRNADTLYVVTGAVLRTAGGSETVRYATPRSDSDKPMAIPNYYYKALLKRSIVDKVPQYKAVAFWFPHQSADRNVQWSDAITVRELERRTGINFFSGLDGEIQEQVEEQYKASDWGF